MSTQEPLAALLAALAALPPEPLHITIRQAGMNITLTVEPVPPGEEGKAEDQFPMERVPMERAILGTLRGAPSGLPVKALAARSGYQLSGTFRAAAKKLWAEGRIQRLPTGEYWLV
jgi:hypothetical protein